MLINKKANTGSGPVAARGGAPRLGPWAPGPWLGGGRGTGRWRLRSGVWRGGGGERLLYYGIAARTRQSQQRELEERSTAT